MRDCDGNRETETEKKNRRCEDVGSGTSDVDCVRIVEVEALVDGHRVQKRDKKRDKRILDRNPCAYREYFHNSCACRFL